MKKLLKSNWFWVIIIFFFVFFIYAFSLYPTIAPRDSGELLIVSNSLGIAHASGYPLYVLLGKIFSLISLANVGYRVNLMSAFFGACTIVILFFLLNKIKSYLSIQGSRYLIFMICILFTTNETIWEQSICAEVFTLNSFLFSLLVLLLITWYFSNDLRYLCLYFFIFGISLGNHQTIVFLLPALIFLLIIYFSKNKFNLKLSYIILFFLIGFTINLFLILRSSQKPIFNWGDPSNVNRLVKLIIRADYGTFKLTDISGDNIYSLQNSAKQIYYYFSSLVGFSKLIIIFSLFGFIFVLRINYKISIFLFIIFLFMGPFFVIISNLWNSPENNAVLKRFLIPAELIISVFFYFFILMVENITKKFVSNKIKYANIIIILFLITIITMSIRKTYQKVSARYNFVSYDISKNIARIIDKESFVLTGADSALYGLWYLQNVLKYRNDIKIIPQSFFNYTWRFEEVKNKWFSNIFLIKNIWYRKELKKYLLDNIIKHNNVYSIAEKELMDVGYYPIPEGGIISKIFHKETNGLIFSTTYSKELSNIIIYRNYNTNNYFTYEIYRQYAISHYALANYLLRMNQLDFSIEEYKKAIMLKPDYAEAYNNMGNVYYKKNFYEEAILNFEKSVEIDPSNIEAICNLGTLYYMQKEYEKSLKQYEIAIKLSPDNQEIAEKIIVLRQLVKE